MKRMFNQRNSRQLILGLGAAVLVAGSALAIDHLASSKAKDVPRAKVEVDETPLQRPAGSYTSFAPIVKKVAPGVVKVVVTSKASNVNLPEGFGFKDPFWRRFFGDQFGNQNAQPPAHPAAPAWPRLGRHRHQRRLHPDQ